jgi:hypothetical protein
MTKSYAIYSVIEGGFYSEYYAEFKGLLYKTKYTHKNIAETIIEEYQLSGCIVVPIWEE